ncbi:lipid-A-disaccharide kinase [Christiangramia gaetbulicola]|uniref:Tetraacyldisaccharide 4'-kinase n=1 Tax=Christiangramia gaetbulicola TaxID=703340 RepID=A0A2T6AE52_9FLAO|nr:tetraacyldisaccharide 4'-kinase [Christiangramia gaetbulicola]PTX42104.1 lipid-A-disaccharide kinase [Christiangramia gaetbulicola]
MPNPRKLLFPFSLIYHGVTKVRNKLYDADLLKSESYDFPVIAVGNLNMGGTGKSPMIEYLLKILSENNKVATLSRGYKRDSKGFQLVKAEDSVNKSGDEPLQFKNKYPEAIVAVDANRREGISELMQFSPDVILLDDAFQHRKVEAGFYILLTAYGDLYVDDLILPAGNLRESSAGAERANIIVVTKCPGNLGIAEMEKIRKRLKPNSEQSVFFSTIKYSEKIISSEKSIRIEDIRESEFALVTGIANPKPLLEFLNAKDIELKHFKFPDHHNFSEKEIEQLSKQSRILTTEKDYMRLKDKLPLNKLYYLPIEVEFLGGGKADFDNQIQNFINKKEV